MPRVQRARDAVAAVGPILRPRRCAAGKIGDVVRARRVTVEIKTYIVEDNPTIRENLIGTLEELASVRAVGWAEGERDARDWLAAHAGEWDLVIVDLFLRQGSGIGVLEACRSLKDGHQVVVLSNYATADMRRRCLELGADAVFDKSNDIDALVEYCLGLTQRAPVSR